MPSRLLFNGECLPILCKCPETHFIRLFRLGSFLCPWWCYRRSLWGPASRRSKAKLVERKVYFRCQPLGAGVVGGHRSRGQLPTLTTSGARAFIDRRRGLLAETAEPALTVIFRLGIGGLISAIMVVLGTVPGPVCSHFFEASSWNCGSLCHGHHIVTFFTLVF